jgi:hypothetical protein
VARARYHVLVRRRGGTTPDEAIVLGDGTIPTFALDDAPPWPVVSPVVEALRERCALEVVVLRPIRVDADATGGIEDRTYEAELVGGRLPRGADWRPAPLPAVEGVAEGIGDGQPWYRPGWFEGWTRWIDERLADAGRRRRGPIRQIRSWARSSLAAVDTDGGHLWAKHVPRAFAHEVTVTVLLGDIDPGIVPPVLAADGEMGRIIVEHVEGEPLTRESAPAAWLATVARLGEAQRVLAGELDAVRAAGVADAPVSALADAIPAILDDRTLLLGGMAGGLTERERVALQARAAELVAAAGSLSASAIGPSLDHGDLSPSQIVIGEMGPVILDWSDATVTHPFLSVVSLLQDPGQVPAELVAEAERAYLATWSRSTRTSDADATEALDAARLVHPLHMAHLYAERVLPGVDQPWEVEGRVPAFLRSLALG